MNYFIYALITFFVIAGLISGMVVWTRHDEYTEATTNTECDSKLNSSNKTCGVWSQDTSTCFKGTCTNCTASDICTKKPNYGVLALMIISGLSFFVFIYFLVMGFKHRGLSSNKFNYHNWK